MANLAYETRLRRIKTQANQMFSYLEFCAHFEANGPNRFHFPFKEASTSLSDRVRFTLDAHFEKVINLSYARLFGPRFARNHRMIKLTVLILYPLRQT